MSLDLGLVYDSDSYRTTFSCPVTVFDYLTHMDNKTARLVASQLYVFSKEKLTEFDQTVEDVNERLTLLCFRDKKQYARLGNCTWSYVQWYVRERIK